MVVFTYDIVIIGAGSAGIAAAVAASEQNRKVLVIEKQSYGGGKATAAEVGTICGLFHQGKHPCPTWLAAGFARKFTEKFLDADEGGKTR
jgi:succinate dehydrogenase/fumarate reductase flavoprotein subunit